jgi:tight adherence protein C
MTVSLRGGLSVEQSLAEAARQSRGPVGRRVRRMQGELAHGTSFREALEHAAYDVGVDEVRRTVQYIQAASSLGTPLEDALRAQADGLREARRQRIVRWGIRASLVMLLPVGLMLVASFVVLLMPAVLQLNAMGS